MKSHYKMSSTCGIIHFICDNHRSSTNTLNVKAVLIRGIRSWNLNEKWISNFTLNLLVCCSPCHYCTWFLEMHTRMGRLCQTRAVRPAPNSPPREKKDGGKLLGSKLSLRKKVSAIAKSFHNFSDCLLDFNPLLFSNNRTLLLLSSSLCF